MATPATWKIDGGVAVITMDDGRVNAIGPRRHRLTRLAMSPRPAAPGGDTLTP